MWAPAIIEQGGRYFLFFGANDIQNDQQPGGIGVAAADRPEGPFKDYLGQPLIDRFHNGAQPIDQFVFRDQDGQHYLIYGGGAMEINTVPRFDSKDAQGVACSKIPRLQFPVDAEGRAILVQDNTCYHQFSR
jgi:beta-xylosidase